MGSMDGHQDEAAAETGAQPKATASEHIDATPGDASEHASAADHALSSEAAAGEMEASSHAGNAAHVEGHDNVPAAESSQAVPHADSNPSEADNLTSQDNAGLDAAPHAVAASSQMLAASTVAIEHGNGDAATADAAASHPEDPNAAACSEAIDSTTHLQASAIPDANSSESPTSNDAPAANMPEEGTPDAIASARALLSTPPSTAVLVDENVHAETTAAASSPQEALHAPEEAAAEAVAVAAAPQSSEAGQTAAPAPSGGAEVAPPEPARMQTHPSNVQAAAVGEAPEPNITSTHSTTPDANEDTVTAAVQNGAAATAAPVNTPADEELGSSQAGEPASSQDTDGAAAAGSSRPASATQQPAAAAAPMQDSAGEGAVPAARPAATAEGAAAAAAAAAVAAATLPHSSSQRASANHPGAMKSSSRPGSAVAALGRLSGGQLRSASSTPRSSARVPVTHNTYDKGIFLQPKDLNAELPLEAVPTTHILSLESHKCNNIFYIEDDVLITSAGNSVVFIRLSDMRQTYMAGLDGGGVGAIAVHPSRHFFAVAEKCRYRAPNVYVYSYPTLALVKVMKNGTEQAYSALAFNDRGDQLASVGSYPDYLLTLWNWEEEAIVLRSKAFSQDVYTVKFSPYFEGFLNTSGMGHIRFWKMASTFTGLKLQGQIGKFGNVELTDVVTFVELPDGKVLSSTEGGEMLMWDGGLIKVVFNRPNRRPCHDGQIHVLLHDRASNYILSGGSDGYVRLWEFNRLNDAEPEEDTNVLTITPVDEVLIALGTRIKSLLWEQRQWLILDEAGALFRVALPDSGALSKGCNTQRLLEFHAGGIVGMVLSPVAHVAVTAGRDGSIRTFEYSNNNVERVPTSPRSQHKLGHSLAFSKPATCMVQLGASASVLVAGFADGVVRVVLRGQDGLRLLAAFKPHKAAITALAVSHNGKHFVTASEDKTVFFFIIADINTFEPICFTRVPAVVTCASWSSDGAMVLAGTKAGTVLELTAPQAGSVDTHRTFEAELPRREFVFKLPKLKKVKNVKKAADPDAAATAAAATALSTDSSAETSAPAAAPAEAPETAQAADGGSAAAEGAYPAAEGEPPAEGAAAAKEEEEVEEEEDSFFQEEEVLEVLTLMHASDNLDSFYLTLSGRAAGQIWQCSFTLPDLAIPVVASFASAPTTFVSYSPSGRMLLLGSADGQVRLQPTKQPFAAGASGRFWQASLHDMSAGRVSTVALSFDEAYMLSASHDGTLYLQEMRMEGSRPAQASETEALMLLSDAAQPATDITNPSEYTIEEAKQKAEQDQLLAKAEAKKMGVREHLQQIRAEFEALVAENANKPEAERLPRSEFEIDPGLREMIEEETKRREAVARLELAWDTEKRRLALAKLKAFFLDKVEVERVVLYAIRSKQYATTFRTAKLPAHVVAELAAIREALEQAAKRAAAGLDTRDSAALSDRARGGADQAESMHKPLSQTDAPAEDTHRMTKADLRRLARKKREAEWAAFNATKPDDKYENPADVAAIAEAENNMGDFKLKSDPNYVIPEEERMTPQRKRQQMLLLEEAMYNVKMDFNRRFLALREVKKKVVSEINAKVSKLRDITNQLDHKDSLMADLVMRPEEVPEARDIVTEEDLNEYARRKEEEERKAVQGSALGNFATGAAAADSAGSGGAAAAAARKAGGTRAAVSAQRAAAEAAATKDAAAAAPAPGAAAGGGNLSTEDALSKMMAAVPQSELERSLQQYQRKKLEYQRSKLQAEIEEMVEAFDDALSQLRREKFRLEADMKLGEIKQLVHHQELVLLQDFDKREILLIQKRQAKQDDRQEILDKICECNDKLESKKLELEGLIARRAAVMAEFNALVLDSDPFREQLSKIFHRRIKRSKKKSSADAGEDYDSEEECEEEDADGDDEDDDDDNGEEICPPGCNQGKYEHVCDLREHRCDEEELMAEFQKTIEVLRKEKEAHAKKQRLVEQGLAAVQQDITEFQKEKQGRLNQIDVVVNLKMHQVEYLVDGRIPEDLSAGLVFSNQELERLKNRIEELEQEKCDLKARQKGLKREHLQLLKDKKAKEDKVSELEARAYDVQMLKFGQVIDMDLLDRIGATQGTEELKEELRKQEAQYAKELAEWDRKIAARTNELMALTRENTTCLNAVSDLTTAQRRLEGTLMATRNTMFSDPVLQRRQEVEERDQLVQMVNAQATEIEKLKMQIAALHKKDTIMYQ